METVFKCEIEANAWDLEHIERNDLENYALQMGFDLCYDFQTMLETQNFEGLKDLYEDMKEKFNDGYGVDWDRMSWQECDDLFERYEDDDFFQMFKWCLKSVENGVEAGGIEVKENTL